jgi:hypothetical protein
MCLLDDHGAFSVDPSLLRCSILLQQERPAGNLTEVLEQSLLRTLQAKIVHSISRFPHFGVRQTDDLQTAFHPLKLQVTVSDIQNAPRYSSHLVSPSQMVSSALMTDPFRRDSQLNQWALDWEGNVNRVSLLNSYIRQ